nr:MAG: terminase large subunit [Caudoviricetes sp.]
MMHPKKRVKISEIVIPKYQQIFNDTTHKHIILTSGRAGTKSSYAAIKADYQIVSDRNGSVVVLRKHHNKLRKTVYKEMLRGINRLQIPKNRFYITKSPMEITYKKYDTTIYFSGSDGIDDTKGIIDEDKPIKLVVLDELTEFFDDGEGEDELANIEATFVRGNKAGFQMIYLYNPPKNPNAPVNKWCRKMEQRPDCIHIHTDYRDVPVEWLGQDLIDSAEAMKQSDEKMYRWTWLGEPVGVDELIYYMFSDRHRQRPEEGRIYERVYIGGDYGQQNATTYQAFGLDNYRRKFTGLGEYYHSGRESGRQRSPSEYAQDLVELMDSIHEQYATKIFYVFLDPSAKGLQEEIRRAARDLDYQVLIRDAENEVALGISRVQKALTFEVMSVAPMQGHAVEEFGLYEYDKKSIEKGKEVPIKDNDHCMDAIRYAVMGAWGRIKHWLPADEVEDEYIVDIARKEIEEDGYI